MIYHKCAETDCSTEMTEGSPKYCPVHNELNAYNLNPSITMNPQTEMPKYECHKKVWALKISKIEMDSEKAQKDNRETDGSAIMTPVEQGYAPFEVDFSYMHKHKPEVGGYYVVYEDGYKSYSPAKAFEDGYTKI